MCVYVCLCMYMCVCLRELYFSHLLIHALSIFTLTHKITHGNAQKNTQENTQKTYFASALTKRQLAALDLKLSELYVCMCVCVCVCICIYIYIYIYIYYTYIYIYIYIYISCTYKKAAGSTWSGTQWVVCVCMCACVHVCVYRALTKRQLAALDLKFSKLHTCFRHTHPGSEWCAYRYCGICWVVAGWRSEVDW
jgi:hypothetical protein